MMNPNTVDVQLFIGPRGSGKSEYVENMISRFKNRLYVGTLWKEPGFEELLRIHRERRDSLWKLVESNGDIKEDKIKIQFILNQMRRPCCSMVDGLTTWAIYNAKRTGDLFNSAREVAYRLDELIYNNPDVTWKLVDVRPIDFSLTNNSIHRHASSIIHGLLAIFIPGIKIIKWEGTTNGRLSNSMGR